MRGDSPLDGTAVCVLTYFAWRVVWVVEVGFSFGWDGE